MKFLHTFRCVMCPRWSWGKLFCKRCHEKHWPPTGEAAVAVALYLRDLSQAGVKGGE